jgi:hypothetical protein
LGLYIGLHISSRHQLRRVPELRQLKTNDGPLRRL